MRTSDIPVPKNYSMYFLAFLLVVLAVLTFFIFKPFVTAIIMAAILAVAFDRPNRFLLKISRGQRSLSALVTSIVIILIVVLPVSFIIAVIFNEVAAFVQDLMADSSGLQNMVSGTLGRLESLGLPVPHDLANLLSDPTATQSLKGSGQVVLSFAQGVYQKTASSIFWIFTMFFALYYFLADGREAVSKLMRLSPIKDAYERVFVEKFVSIVRATLKGIFIIGVIQGTLGGLAFGIVGIPSPVVWGVVMTVLAFIPMLGAGIVWLPASIILMLNGQLWEGLFIFFFGLLFISLIDNLLRPKLVGEDTQMHPLLVFFATLGGLILFGPTGIILGPVILALFITVLEIYSGEFKAEIRHAHIEE